MAKLAMLVSVCAVAFGVQVCRVAADEVPTYDVRKTCKTDTQILSGSGHCGSGIKHCVGMCGG